MTTGILSLGLFLLVFVSSQAAEFGHGETILFEKDRSDVQFTSSDSEQDHPANAKDADNRVPTDMASENPKNSAITEVEAGSTQKKQVQIQGQSSSGLVAQAAPSQAPQAQALVGQREREKPKGKCRASQ